MQGTESPLVMRRLNRAEYQHTMTDLMGFDMDYSDELPNDSLSPDGFLNNGATQVTSAVQIENYLKSARKALDYVLLDGQKPETSTSAVVWNKGNIRGPGNKRLPGLLITETRGELLARFLQRATTRGPTDRPGQGLYGPQAGATRPHSFGSLRLLRIRSDP